ncbi:MAG: response regulator [Acholeplasmataceae bacterium]|nr:response regulator [Acholeplasmataceae bacterium]
MIDSLEKTASKQTIHHLGPFIMKNMHAYNNYVVFYNDLVILIDVPPIQVLDLFYSTLTRHVEMNKITHIIIHHINASTFIVLNDFVNHGFVGKVITNKYFEQQIRYLKTIKVELIDEMNYQLISQNQIIFKFIPMIFLPFPDMFMTYMPSELALFSSTLFSSDYDPEVSPSINQIKNSIFSFHKSNMPSSSYIQKPLRIVRDFDVHAIYPSMGYLISKQIIESIFSYELLLDFYNNYQVFMLDSKGDKTVNYREIINHMINHLLKTYSKIEILNTFVGTPIGLQPDPLMLNKTSLDGYKLWHLFFEHIYVKKGIEWITILEPLVNRYYDEYGIEKPNIYLSKFIEMTLKANSLKQANSELEQHIEQLNNEITNTMDNFMKCPITKLYNQDFFTQLLKSDLEKEKNADKTKGFILVQLDQLMTINQQYGKQAGDEAIRHMSYEIQQVMRPDSLVFKQNGPGIIVYQESTVPKNIETSSVNFRNRIAESNLFIEKVSAAISSVDLNEIDQDLETDQKIKAIFDLLVQRGQMALKQGSGSITDRSTKHLAISDGCILLVDEDEVNLNMLNRIFKRINFDVKIAHGVIEAIELIKENSIDVIISEINLSKIDGFTLKQMLNESKDFQKIPFIMVSHNKTLENIKRGNSLYVNLMLEKPIIPDELIGHVKRYKTWVKQQ